MHDDIEERLRRYRPAAPTSALRDRIVAAAPESAIGARGVQAGVLARSATWLPAAAAVILIVLFSWMSSMERARIESRVSPAPDDSATPVATETWP